MPHVTHPFPPCFDGNSRVLILGTMPSPASRAAGFYYGHPRNRFWPALAAIFGEPCPGGADARRDFALRHGVALWDVLGACRIEGAADGSIGEPAPNDIASVLAKAPIRAVFTTGRAAFDLYRRHCLPHTGIEAVALPSSSPANCAMRFEELVERYGVIAGYLQ